MSSHHHHHHHHRPGAASSSTSSDEETDPTSERLWTDFEQGAQSVAVLFRDPGSWKAFQTAAASTTQLYKSGVDAQRRGFERGLAAGKKSLAKELLQLVCNSRGDPTLLWKLVSAQAAIGGGRPTSPRRSSNTGSSAPPPSTISSSIADVSSAVNLFQQALGSTASSPHRGGGGGTNANRSELNAFLGRELARRNRKRSRSPSSPSSLLKKMRHTGI